MMKTLMQTLKQASAVASFAVLGLIGSADPANASGLLTAKGSDTQLQIKDHIVKVAIEDGYAITSVENTFYNPSANDLEAVYEFPVPENGTVAEFTVWIDDQPIIGEVVKKERARKLYEAEKAAGRDVGLTEQKSFFRFESKVYPVRPQQVTKTRIVYMQPADVQGGIGRYVYPLEEGGTDQEKLDFWQTDEKVHGQFSFDMTLRSGFPVDAVRSPAHSQAVISNADSNNWRVSINPNGVADKPTPVGEAVGHSSLDAQEQRLAEFSDLAESSASYLNQDVVVYWRLQQDLPGAIELVAHREPSERKGTFMMTITPGIDLQEITEGRDWVFVLDRSGSMSGKYHTLMDAASQAISKLRGNDRFRVLLFDDEVEELSRGWMIADQVSIAQIADALNRSSTGGGTDLYRGLKAAIDGLDADRTSSIVLITDGVANVGKTQKRDFIDLLNKQDVRLFTAIMGNGANRPMLNSMTKVSKGFATSVSNSDDVMGVMLGALEKVKYEALHDVSLKIKGVKTADLVSNNAATLYRGQQMVILGHYYGDGEAQLTLNVKISGEDKQYQTRFEFPEVATTNPEIERLWAYAKIQELKDESDYLGTNLGDYSSAITNTAIEYGLVTEFTSMIVMSEEQLAANGIKRTNRDRREKERQAQQQRAAQPVTQRQVDRATPAFPDRRPNYSGSGGGGGAIGPWSFVLALPLLLAFLRRRMQFSDDKAKNKVTKI